MAVNRIGDCLNDVNSLLRHKHAVASSEADDVDDPGYFVQTVTKVRYIAFSPCYLDKV